MEHARTSLHYTTVGHFAHLHTRGNPIYLFVLCLLVAAFFSLFFIRVPVTVTSQGMLTPVTERSTVKSLVNGRVQHVAIRENQAVQAGDILLTLSADAIEG